jgi:hypothetical protein
MNLSTLVEESHLLKVRIDQSSGSRQCECVTSRQNRVIDEIVAKAHDIFVWRLRCRNQQLQGDEMLRHEMASVRARWPELFKLLDLVDLRLSSTRCATALRLRSGAELERELRRRALPRFSMLRDWYYVIAMYSSTRDGCTLSTFAIKRGGYPSILYRFTYRVTGRPWREIEQLDFRELCVLASMAWTAAGGSCEIGELLPSIA